MIPTINRNYRFSNTARTVSERRHLRKRRQTSRRFQVEQLETRLLLAAVSAANLRLPEINYNPAAASAAELVANPTLDNDHFEFLEFQNISNETIELANARITAGISFDFQNANPGSIAPGEFFVLARDIAAFQIRYGPLVTVVGQFASRGYGSAGRRNNPIRILENPKPTQCLKRAHGPWN
ncbi:MAG: hypothetical protein ACI9G1_003259 [Pirellulaceae bacterium]|jgi:hypothetical protein